MENTTPIYSNKRPLWQWLIIYTVLGLAVYIAIYFAFFKNRPYTPNETAQSTVIPASTTSSVIPGAGQFTITYTSDGFSPQNITIRPGDSIIWVNQSGTNIDIASSPHPSHTDYPPLNLGIVRSSESKSLTFPNLGTYRFHNHLNAAQFGRITVQ